MEASPKDSRLVTQNRGETTLKNDFYTKDHVGPKENETIQSIKSTLMFFVEEWLGYDIPRIGTEDYKTWRKLLAAVKNFKTIDDLPETLDIFGKTYLDFIIECQLDLVDAGMNPAEIPRVILEELGEDIEEDLDEELRITKLSSCKNAKVYSYGGKYFLFLARDKEERQVFDNMSDALLSIGIDINMERSEKSTPAVIHVPDRHYELEQVKNRISKAIENRPRTTKYIIVTEWPNGTMAMKFGSALRGSLYVSKEEMQLVQLAPERIFRTVSSVSEQEFFETLSKHDVSCPGKIFFIDVANNNDIKIKDLQGRSTGKESASYKHVAEPLVKLVFENIGGSLVFIEFDKAKELAKFWEDMRTTSTWGEFKLKSPYRYEDLVCLCYEGEQPEDTEPFPGTDIPVMNDGDYPEWPAQLMLSFLPKEIINSSFAKVQNSVHNGQYLELDAKMEGQIVKILTSKGYEVKKDEKLVRLASGYC